MSSVSYRKMRRVEALTLETIDRSELIDGFYSISPGRLVLRKSHEVVSSWSKRELACYVSRLCGLIDSGGMAFGAWQASSLVGVASLDLGGVGDRM